MGLDRGQGSNLGSIESHVVILGDPPVAGRNLGLQMKSPASSRAPSAKLRP